MATRTPTQRLSCNEIISTIAGIELKKMGNSGEVPSPTLADLQNFTQNAQDNDGVVIGMGPRYDVYTPGEYKQFIANMKQSITSPHNSFKKLHGIR